MTDITDGIVGKPVSFSINASQAGAGNLEIIVAVAGRNVPNFVQSEGNARFKVNFKPTEAATHTLSVRLVNINKTIISMLEQTDRRAGFHSLQIKKALQVFFSILFLFALVFEVNY